MDLHPCLPGFEKHRVHLRAWGRLTIAEIQKLVADFYHIPVNEMTSHCRQRKFARPRQVAMYLSREFTPKSLPDIGRRFGNRDHTTVIHGIRQVENLCIRDAEIRDDLDRLCKRLAG